MNAAQSKRVSNDAESIQKVLKNFNIEKNHLKIFRLGKYLLNKNGPIKVVLKSADDDRYVLRNKKLT